MATVAVYTRAAQVALGGYAKGQLVNFGGVTWRSTVNKNMTIPGDGAWELAG